MHGRCTGCSARYWVDDEHGGRWGECSQCKTEVMLPIPDAKRLLDWASSAHWDNLEEFVNNEGARGHSFNTICKFIRIFERRRWTEENRIQRESQNSPVLSRREEIWTASDRRLQRRQSLEELRSFDPYKFERFIAELFELQGYIAKATGGTNDGGIDVQIRGQDGILWGVAQCKRYNAHTRISAAEIRDFGGAFMLSGAGRGFFFTTSVLTRNAKRTARGFPWLTTYNGRQLVDYIEKINTQIEETSRMPNGSSDSTNSE